MDSFAAFCCTQCEFQTRIFWSLIKHYELQHSGDARFRAICGVDNCPKSYHNVRALCAHLRSKHAVFYGEHMVTPKNVITQNTSGLIQAYESEEGSIHLHSSNTIPAMQSVMPSNVSNTSQACVKESLVNNVAAWSLKLREIKKIPGGACEEIRHHVLTEYDSSILNQYPMPGEWNYIIEALFESLPRLRSQHVAINDAQTLWRNRLIRFFQNTRSRKDNRLSIVIQHKKSSSRQPKTPVVKRKSVVLFGVLHYLPERPLGETDETVEDMVKIMRDENRRAKKNETRIDHLMTQTFADRRKMVVSEGVSTAELKERFPCLFNEHQLCAEFLRLTEVNAVDALQDLLQEYANAIIDMVDDHRNRLPHLLTDQLKKMEGAKSTEAKRDLTWAAAVVGLPYLLGDDPNTIFGYEESVDYAVYVVLEQQQSMCNVYVDGELIGYCSLPMALTLYAVCFYALNLCFPDHSAKTLLFIQKFVFKINDVNCDQHVTRLMRAGIALMEKLCKKRTTTSKTSAPTVVGCKSRAQVEDTVENIPSVLDDRRPDDQESSEPSEQLFRSSAAFHSSHNGQKPPTAGKRRATTSKTSATTVMVSKSRAQVEDTVENIPTVLDDRRPNDQESSKPSEQLFRSSAAFHPSDNGQKPPTAGKRRATTSRTGATTVVGSREQTEDTVENEPTVLDNRSPNDQESSEPSEQLFRSSAAFHSSDNGQKPPTAGKRRATTSRTGAMTVVVSRAQAEDIIENEPAVGRKYETSTRTPRERRKIKPKRDYLFY